ncbi:MAG: ATP-dependent sacrificial sulfur transferase LarE [Chloroflexia bacterium]
MSTIAETRGAPLPMLSTWPEGLDERRARLEEIVGGLGRVIVAYSGGVDSALVLKVCRDVLGKGGVLGVLAQSESYASREMESALATAAAMDAEVRVIHTQELENSDYAANPVNRCYFCKQTLFDDLSPLSEAEGYDNIVDGFNADDVGDHRPGRQAARERGVRSPLLEAGLNKADIRVLARQLGLTIWNKPSLACLSSRIPYGTPVTAEALAQIDAAENLLRDLGFEQVRVRHHAEQRMARIEVDPTMLPLLVEPGTREKVVARLKQLGYRYVAIDLAGYRSGSLNEALTR